MHYKPLVDFAKENSIPVLAINKKFSKEKARFLKKRDEAMAQTISEKWVRGKLIYGIVGEYHLAKEHLPRKIYHLMGQWPRIIHQNSEKLYFEWAERSPETPVEVMRSEEGQFCVLTSPPWVKWQSYLIYLERTHDQHLDFDGEELIENIDYTDSINSLVQFLANDLELEVDTSDLCVYSPVDQDYLDSYLSQKMTPEELEVVRWKMNNDRSFYIPHEGIVYLSRGTINHAATMAGQYLHGKVCSRNRVFWNFPDDFYLFDMD